VYDQVPSLRNVRIVLNFEIVFFSFVFIVSFSYLKILTLKWVQILTVALREKARMQLSQRHAWPVAGDDGKPRAVLLNNLDHRSRLSMSNGGLGVTSKKAFSLEKAPTPG
jgi:hypothetical protein